LKEKFAEKLQKKLEELYVDADEFKNSHRH